MAKKRDNKLEPATLIILTRTENGWHLSSQPGSREAIAATWDEATELATKLASAVAI